jgi:CO/xanthine dehydrogenase FAD-binding subunit
VTEAETFLRGATISEEVIEEVGEIARKAAHPVANTISTPGYRRNMAAVFTKKALREAVSRAKAR